MESNPFQNHFKNGCMDRISNLPDSILGHILSYLPTKNAAATSILSTRWKNLFPFEVHPLSLDLDDSDNMPDSNSFMDFVDRLINENLRDLPVPSIDILMLKCEKHYGDYTIVSWICCALELNVKRLILKFFLHDSVNLFESFNGYKTLVRLDLGKNFDLFLPGDFTLPNLKWLFLDRLKFHAETKLTNSIQNLLDGCPLLEDLSFYGCDWQLLETLCIRFPLLRGLYIEECCNEMPSELVVDAPNLEGLFYIGNAAVDYFVTNFKSLLFAHIDVGPCKDQLEEAEEEGDYAQWYFDTCLAKLVSFNTTHLYLSKTSIAALHCSSFPLPTFQNLIFLALGCMGWKLLARLLQSAPNLEIIKIEEGFEEYKGAYAGFESLLPSLPNCLEKHIKKIEFWVFKGEEDEFKLIEYFLKNGKNLQTLKISCLPCEDLSVLVRLIMMQRHSKTCQIKLRDK